jgi:hypothetical protein
MGSLLEYHDMALSETDKVVIREIVRNVVQTPEMNAVLRETATKAARAVIASHLESCPVRRRVDRAKWLIFGVLIVGLLTGFSAAPLLLKLLALL